MIRLQIEGTWIDTDDKFDFELKWKHPIQNNLKGESTTYSTDMIVPLTENNKLAFDYKIFTSSAKTNKYLYGQLIVNGSTMPVRCYVQQFLNNGIKFFLQEFRSGTTSVFLKDVTTMDNIYLPAINAGTETDIMMNLSTGVVQGGTLPDIFAVLTLNGRQNVYASTYLLQQLAILYGVTLVNNPTSYHVFCNQWKARTGLYADLNLPFYQERPENVFSNVQFANTDNASPIYIKDTNTIVSIAPFDFEVTFPDYGVTGPPGSYTIYFQIVNKTTSAVFWSKTEVVTFATGVIASITITCPFVIPAGEYYFQVKCSNEIIIYESDPPTNEGKVALNFIGIESDYPDFIGTTSFPCWQNLPKITAKTLFETIAVCAGKMIEYKDDTITFIDFADVFDPASAVDISDKLVSWKTKDFKFLSANNATVNYASGQVIATVIIDDETLPTDTNSVATIDAIRIQDDTATDRVTDKLVLAQTPTGSFEVISQLAELYAPLTSPKLFEAEFIYFADNKRPLLIRQLGGIFIALESIISTKTTITLKLLKIA